MRSLYRVSWLSLSLLMTLGCGSDKTTQPTPAPASADKNAKGVTSSAAVPSGKASAGSAAAPLASTTAAASATGAASSTASASAAAAKPTGRYQKLSDEEVQKLVKPQLGQGETLAHDVYRGPFGPSQSTVVVLTQRDKGGLTTYGGFLLYERDGKSEKLALPDLHDSNNGHSIDAISFIPDADADKVEEALIIGSYLTGVGKDGAKPFSASTVIDVNGTEVTRLTDIEALAGSATTVADVRKAILSRTFVLRLDGAPIRIAPTLDRETAVARLSKLLGGEPVSNSEQRVQFDYGAQGGEPVSCILDFGDRGVKGVRKITVAAKTEAQNGSATSLDAWLKRRRMVLKPDGEVRKGSYNGWEIQMQKPSADAAKPSLVITRK